MSTTELHMDENLVRCTDIKYKPTKRYLKIMADNDEEKPPTEIDFYVSGDWWGERWFSNKSLVTKQMIRDETGFTPIEWTED